MDTKWVTTDIGVDKARTNTDEWHTIHPPCRERWWKGRGVEPNIVARRDHDWVVVGKYPQCVITQHAGSKERRYAHSALRRASIANARPWARRKRIRATSSGEGGNVVCSAPRRIHSTSSFLTAATNTQPKA